MDNFTFRRRGRFDASALSLAAGREWEQAEAAIRTLCATDADANALLAAIPTDASRPREMERARHLLQFGYSPADVAALIRGDEPRPPLREWKAGDAERIASMFRHAGRRRPRWLAFLLRVIRWPIN